MANAEKHGSLPLSELSSQSASFGEWQMVVHFPRTHKYQYKQDGIPKDGQVFKCVLTSIADAKLYVVGEAKNDRKNIDAISKCMKQFQDGIAFKMTKVSFRADAPKRYTHSPCFG